MASSLNSNSSNGLVERKKVYEFIANGLQNSNGLLQLNDKYLTFVKRLIYSDNFDDSGTIKDLVLWAKNHSYLKATETPVLNSIIQNDAVLIDIKVQSRGPDDTVYDRNNDIRAKIARGNTVLKIKDNYSLLLYALRKFAGGLGDEDEIERSKSDWRKYFLKDIKKTEYVISLEKANGEAAHFSCRWIDNGFLLCAGSKNVHLVFRNESEIDSYKEEKFSYARTIAKTLVVHLNKMHSDSKDLLLSFLCWTRLTVIFEILIPDSQHVVDLSYLKEPLLKFITFTESKIYEKPTNLCCMPPELSIEIGKLFEFSCVDWEKISYSDIENHLIKIRSDNGYEGKVLYFIDSDFNVIGLLKKKTTWYIIIRAIREKLRNFISVKSTKTKDELDKAISSRLNAIQKWIGFNDDDLAKWLTLCHHFVDWFDVNFKSNKFDRDDFTERFPVIWNRFLKEENFSDKIEIHLTSEDDLKDDS